MALLIIRLDKTCSLNIVSWKTRFEYNLWNDVIYFQLNFGILWGLSDIWMNSSQVRSSLFNFASRSLLVKFCHSVHCGNFSIAWYLLKCFFAPLFRENVALLDELLDIKNIPIGLPDKTSWFIFLQWLCFNFVWFWFISALKLSFSNKVKSTRLHVFSI